MEISQEILDKVAQLQLMARKSLTTLLAGDYQSSFHGSKMQFKKFHHYEPGDDIRHMSWPVTARTNRPTLKVYEKKRELNVLILVDVSGSSIFGIRKRKIDMYAELVALLGLTAVKSGDNVGMLLFSDKVQHYLPPRDSQNHVLNGIVTLLQQPLLNQTSDLGSALLYTQNVLKSRAILILMSDFIIPPFHSQLQILARRHELVLLHCYDDAERGFLDKGVYEVCHPETREYFLLDSGSSAVQKAFSNSHVMLQHELEDIYKIYRADYLYLSIQDDYLQRLVHFFRRRGPSRL